jgi:membrane protein DedA with SNARE-associated domain
MKTNEQQRQEVVTSIVARLLALSEGLARRMPSSRGARLALAVAAAALVLAPSIALLLLPIWVDLSEEHLKGFGYAGIFLANLASTATVFIPVPGLTAAGQALILSGGKTLSPVPVGLLGGTGMALGEITAYVAGTIGHEMAEGRTLGGPQWFRRTVDRTARAISWLMARYGMLTLFVLSAVPNPAFELAGLTAGAVRMNFWRFMLAVLAGKNVRGLALAFLGYYSIEILGL